MILSVMTANIVEQQVNKSLTFQFYCNVYAFKPHIICYYNTRLTYTQTNLDHNKGS